MTLIPINYNEFINGALNNLGKHYASGSTDNLGTKTSPFISVISDVTYTIRIQYDMNKLTNVSNKWAWGRIFTYNSNYETVEQITIFDESVSAKIYESIVKIPSNVKYIRLFATHLANDAVTISINYENSQIPVKTILKLHANGDFETVNTNIIQSGIAGNYSFKDNEITVPTIIEYPPEHLTNYFVKKTSVAGWVADFEQGVIEAGELNPPYENHDRTSDFIDVSDWNDFTVRIVQKNLVSLAPYYRVLTYDSNKKFKRIFYEVAFQENTLENGILIATLKATLNDDDKYIRVSLNHYDNPTVITKITVNKGLTSNEKYYLAVEDMPEWVRNTGNPISIFDEGIVLKGELIESE